MSARTIYVWPEPGYTLVNMFGERLDYKATRALIRKLGRNIKKAVAELADCEKNLYPLGARIATEDIAYWMTVITWYEELAKSLEPSKASKKAKS